MRKLTITLISLPFVAFCGWAQAAGDATKGEAKAEVCANCHDPSDFKGESEAEIAGKIRDHESGKVKHPSMGNKVDPADVDDVAAYLAAEAAKSE